MMARLKHFAAILLFLLFPLSAWAVDTTPPAGTVTINNGAVATKNTSVSLQLNATDDVGVTHVRFSNDNAVWSSWMAYSTPKSWPLEAIDGTKTVYAQFKDAAGNISTAASDTIILDRVIPTGTVNINNGAAATKNRTANVNLTASGTGSNATHVRFSNDNVTWSVWLAYSISKSWAMSTGDGTKTVYAQFQDAAGNTSTTVSDTIILDTALPTGTININSGAAATNTRTSSIALTASGTGTSATHVRFSNDNVTWSVWQAYSTPKTWSLSTGDGTKTVYAQFMDAAGNISNAVNDTIILDTVLPTGTVSINSGAASTNNRTASLALTSSGTGSSVTHVRFSNDNAIWSTWRVYATPLTWALATGDGTKTAYAQFKDAAGNISTAVNDTIILDTALPTGTVSIKNGAAATNTLSNNIVLTASDTASAVTGVRFSNDGTTWGSWLAYSTPKTHVMDAGDGTKTVYAQFQDAAGNVSTAVSDTIVLDTALPTGSVSIKGGAAATNLLTNNIALTASGTGSNVTHVRFSNDNVTWSAWLAYSTPKSWSLTGADGIKAVYAQFKDAAGNNSTTVSDTINLDRVIPTGTVSINSGAATTNSLTNTLALSASGTGSDVVNVRLSEDGSTWGSWLAYEISKSFDFTGADGSKTVYVQFQDAAGNVSSNATDSITLDTTAPTSSVIINLGSSTTVSTTVTLGLSATDATTGVTHMRFSNDNVTFSSWAAYAATYAWNLPAGGGTKTVYAQFKDGAGNVSGSSSDTIVLVSTYNVSGQITNNGAPMSNLKVTLNTPSPMEAFTDYSGSYLFSNVIPGSYTVTPSAPGANGAVFSPATAGITVTSSDVNVPEIKAAVSYTVSGTVYYSGSKTGRIYLRAGGSGFGTSISSAGPFTIHGFTPGGYSINAFLDYNGNLVKTAMTPSGSSTGFSISDSNVTGVNIFISDPVSPAPQPPPAVAAYKGLNSVFVAFEPERINGEFAADAFNIYYKTSPGVTKLNGTKIGPIKISDNPFYLHGGLTNGTTYYYVVTTIVNGVESALSNEASATVGARTGARTVSGTITRNFTSTGPLYVGLYGFNDGIFYFTRVASPAAGQAYSIPGVPDGDYFFAVIFDMNNSGSVDEGDVTNFGTNNTTTVSGNLTKNATVDNVLTNLKLNTNHGKFSYTSGEWYNLNFSFDTEGSSKFPVKATIVSGPNLPVPMDIGFDTWETQLWVNPIVPPVAGQTYTVDFTYSDGTTGTLTPSVTGVVNAFATPVSPSGYAPGTTPTFTWSAPSPAPPAPYYYSIGLWGGNTWWYNDTPMPSSTLSAPFNYDGGASQTALTPGVQHYWNIMVVDQYGNSSENQLFFTPY